MLNLRDKNLFDQVLISPAREGARTLVVVAGYCSPKMLAFHLSQLRNLGLDGRVTIKIFVGMQSSNQNEATKAAFLGLSVKNESFDVQVHIPSNSIQVHSKAYLWENNGIPYKAWIGSANYSMLAFGLRADSDQRDELLGEYDPEKVSQYVQKVMRNSELLSDGTSRNYLVSGSPDEETQEFTLGNQKGSYILPSLLPSDRFAICPLFDTRTKSVHNPGAGLNWGQPTATRNRSDKDAAYIPLPSQFSGIFPGPGQIFEVVFSDGEVMMMSRSQSGGKAITTPASNAILGKYFRSVLGVKFGERVIDADLESYGSDAVVFEKISESAFSLHFYPGLIYADLLARLER